MKKKYWILTILALVMVMGVALKPSLAYFTSYSSARGGVKITFGGGTSMDEPKEPSDMTKYLVVKADEGANPMWVRAFAFAPDGFELNYEGTNWTVKDGYAYYDVAIADGQTTEELQVHFAYPEDYKLKEGDSYNIIVMYEAVPYIEGVEPDWNAKVVKEAE